MYIAIFISNKIIVWKQINGNGNLNFDKGNNKTKILNLGVDPEVKGVFVQFPILV